MAVEARDVLSSRKSPVQVGSRHFTSVRLQYACGNRILRIMFINYFTKLHHVLFLELLRESSGKILADLIMNTLVYIHTYIHFFLHFFRNL